MSNSPSEWRRELRRRFSLDGWGITEESYIREKYPKQFKKFLNDAHHTEWTELHHAITPLFTQIPFEIYRLSLEYLLSSAPSDESHSPIMLKGHNVISVLEENLESLIELKLQTRVFTSFPEYTFAVHSEHSAMKNMWAAEKKEVAQIDILYDVLDGQTNFIHLLQNFVDMYNKRAIDYFSKFTPDSCFLMSLSLKSFPNFPFVSFMYSFKNKELTTFFRQDYNQPGLAQIYPFIDEGNSMNIPLVQPSPRLVPGIRFINSGYDSTNIADLAAGSDAAGELFNRYGRSANVGSIGSNSTANDLHSLCKGTVSAVVDFRSLLPQYNPTTAAQLWIEDIMPLIPMLNAAEFITMRTDGTRFEQMGLPEEKSPPQTISTDLFATSQAMMPYSPLDPDPRDIVLLARLAVLQNFYSPIDPKTNKKVELGILNAIKVSDQYRLFIGMPLRQTGVFRNKYLEQEVFGKDFEHVDLLSDQKCKLDDYATGNKQNNELPSQDLLNNLIAELTDHLEKQTYSLTEHPLDRLGVCKRRIMTNANLIGLQGLLYSTKSAESPNRRIKKKSASSLFSPSSSSPLFTQFQSTMRSYTDNLAKDFNTAEQSLRELNYDDWRIGILLLRRDLSMAYANLSQFYGTEFIAEKSFRDNHSILAREESIEEGILRHLAIYNSQLAVDHDPFNFHYIKQHASNYALALDRRLPTACILLIEALELGTSQSGIRSSRYTGLLKNWLEKLDSLAPGSATKVLPMSLRETIRYTAAVENYDKQ